MSTELQTMSVNALLEEIAVTESVNALYKIEKLAKVELVGANVDVAKAINRLIKFKMRLHTKRLLNYTARKPSREELEGFSSLKKLIFHDCASSFFTGIGYETVLQVLEEAARTNPQLCEKADSAINSIRTLDYYWRDAE